MSENTLERPRHVVDFQRVHQQRRVEDFSASLRSQKPPELFLHGPLSLCGLPLKGPKGSQFASRIDEAFDGRRTEGANELPFQVGGAHEEPERLHCCLAETRSQAGPFKGSSEIVHLRRVAQPRQLHVEASRTESIEVRSDVLRAAHRHDRDALRFEVPTKSGGESLNGQLVADPLDQDDDSRGARIGTCHYRSVARQPSSTPARESGGTIEKQKLAAREERGVSFGEATRFWVKLGFINFGGPTGQIALMHEELVVRRRWISNGRFLHALNYCMLLPGPEAQQLAIYVGWLFHRMKGGLIAGIAFILPAFFLILALSWTYAVHGDLPAVAGVFSGLQAAVVGIVAAAVIRVGRRAVHNGVMAGIAAAAFLGIFVAHVPFPYIVVGAAMVGFLGRRIRPELFALAEMDEEGEDADGDGPTTQEETRPTLGRSLRVLVVGAAVWVIPLAVVVVLAGAPRVLSQEAVFFSQAAMVTFGGAYAVLAYLNQAAVQQFGWLLPGQMVTGLGLAESTPGPLILVTEFVGFVGAYRNPGGLDPAVAGVLGAVVATWATFAPCFLWIFLGAPYIERLRNNRTLTAALSSITAAVAGVILNLAVTFAIHVLFERVTSLHVLGGQVPMPAPASLDVFAFGVALTSFLALWRWKLNVLLIVVASAAAGAIRMLIQ